MKAVDESQPLKVPSSTADLLQPKYKKQDLRKDVRRVVGGRVVRMTSDSLPKKKKNSTEMDTTWGTKLRVEQRRFGE